jgi:hypothetical protein
MGGQCVRGSSGLAARRPAAMPTERAGETACMQQALDAHPQPAILTLAAPALAAPCMGSCPQLPRRGSLRQCPPTRTYRLPLRSSVRHPTCGEAAPQVPRPLLPAMPGRVARELRASARRVTRAPTLLLRRSCSFRVCPSLPKSTHASHACDSRRCLSRRTASADSAATRRRTTKASSST